MKKFIKECQKNNLSLRLVDKEIDLSYNLLVDKINFKIVGKIDRIDTVDNQLRIIDYKTGKVDSQEVVFSDLDDLFYNPNKSKALQLLIYTFLYTRNYPSNLKMKVIAGIYSFKNLQNGLLYVKQKKSSGKATPYFINEDFLNDFETKLKELLQRIKSSNFYRILILKNVIGVRILHPNKLLTKFVYYEHIQNFNISFYII